MGEALTAIINYFANSRDLTLPKKVGNFPVPKADDNG